MSALVTDNLPLIATAPDGIKRLRGLILELAVRGKLVPQNPADEPASELLKRIEAEKARLVKEGRIRKPKAVEAVGEDERPFEVPGTWQWIRLTEVANPQAGFAFKSSAFNEAGHGLPLIRIRDVGFSSPITYFDGPYRDEFVVHTGDYLVSMDGQFRVAAWQGPPALLNQRVSRLQFYGDEIVQQFIAASLQFRLSELQGVKAYTTVDHLSGGQIASSAIPLPPLPEQHRIVARVDELMALCDRLEAEQADAAEAHARLVDALLATLTASRDAAECAANWQRLSEHFDTLFTTEASITALKQTVLQLAVMGRLVPQDPTDEPASELLKRIEAEKARLVKEGKIRKPKAVEPVGEDERPFEAPLGWEWARIGSVVVDSGAGWSPACESRPRFDAQEWGVLKVSAVTWGSFDPDANKALPAHLDPRPEHEVQPGDFLVSRANTAELVARSVFVENCAPRLMLSDKIVRLKLATAVSGRYINIVNSCEHARAYYAAVAGGTSSSMKNVSREQILSLPLSLPPLPEQHRIVARVDELMALCDRLQADLATARDHRARLADTLVQAALEAA